MMLLKLLKETKEKKNLTNIGKSFQRVRTNEVKAATVLSNIMVVKAKRARLGFFLKYIVECKVP